jgi:Lon protease-like protein
MNSASDNSADSLPIQGAVRLFPLPDLVMFPHVVQPLHIFEPRYCEMLEDALASDKRIAMVLLAPGWEADYEGRPAIAPVACVGRIMAHERLPTGRHNILLRGLSRAAIRRELPPQKSFREAEVDLLADFCPAASAVRHSQLQQQLIDLARRLLPDTDALHEQLDAFLSGEASLGMLTDIFAFTFGLPTAVKQRLLAQWHVERRAQLLITQLGQMAAEPWPSDRAPTESLPLFRLN